MLFSARRSMASRQPPRRRVQSPRRISAGVASAPICGVGQAEQLCGRDRGARDGGADRIASDRMTDVATDEDMITEITIAPDGRVYVFGMSRQVMQMMEVLEPNDAKLQRLLQHVRQL